jgi:predicted nucleic acid-binding protein
VSAQTILDTGPLVAFLNPADNHHEWAAAQLRRLKPPLLTCEIVLGEACFVLQARGRDPSAVLDMVARGAVKVEFSLTSDVEAVRRLLRRYADMGASLADVCLVRMSEIYSNCQVLTLDRDFLIYRRDGRRVIPLIAPFEA